MVKSPPSSPLLINQPQIVFAPLKVLFDGPASAAQAQASACGGTLLEPGGVNMVGVRLPLRPINDQPAWWPLSGLFVQIAVKINLLPGQSRRPFFPTGRLPDCGVPFSRFA